MTLTKEQKLGKLYTLLGEVPVDELLEMIRDAVDVATMHREGGDAYAGIGSHLTHVLASVRTLNAEEFHGDVREAVEALEYTESES